MDKWEIIAKRKRDKKLQNNRQGMQLGLKYRTCGICGKPYCCNNYQDRKTRIKRWHGLEVCASCQFRVVRYVPKLIEVGILKFTKEHKP